MFHVAVYDDQKIHNDINIWLLSRYTSPSLDYLDLVHPSHKDLNHLKHPSHPPGSTWDALQNIFPYGSLRCIKALRDVKMYNQCTFVYLCICICMLEN